MNVTDSYVPSNVAIGHWLHMKCIPFDLHVRVFVPHFVVNCMEFVVPEVAVDLIRAFYFSRNIQHLFAWKWFEVSICWPVWCGRIHHHDECIITNTINDQISNMDGIKYRNRFNWSHTNDQCSYMRTLYGVWRSQRNIPFFISRALSASLTLTQTVSSISRSTCSNC